MECYLHIGTEKTGSSTLQEFLYINQKTLECRGYYIPRRSGKKDDWLVAVACYNPGRRSGSTISLRIDSDAKLEAFRRAIFSDFQKEIRAATQPRLILSCEDFSTSLTTPEELQRLKTGLEEAGVRKTTVIVYLRDPAEMINSHYCGAVMGGATDEAPLMPEAYPQCDYAHLLTRWSEAFGRENIRPRLYSRAMLKEGSVVHDFLGCVNLDDAEGLTIPQNANAACSHNCLEIVRRINVLMPPTVGNRNIARENLISYVKKHLTGPRYVMPETLFQHYDAVFAESNEWVRAHWFPERSMLFDRTSRRPSTVSDFPPAQADAVARLLVAAWNDMPRQTLWIAKVRLAVAIFPTSFYRSFSKVRYALAEWGQRIKEKYSAGQSPFP